MALIYPIKGLYKMTGPSGEVPCIRLNIIYFDGPKTPERWSPIVLSEDTVGNELRRLIKGERTFYRVTNKSAYKRLLRAAYLKMQSCKAADKVASLRGINELPQDRAVQNMPKIPRVKSLGAVNIAGTSISNDFYIL